MKFHEAVQNESKWTSDRINPRATEILTVSRRFWISLLTLTELKQVVIQILYYWK